MMKAVVLPAALAGCVHVLIKLRGCCRSRGRLRKAIAHIKPRSKAERAAAKVVAQKERAVRNKRRRQEMSESQ